MPNAARFYCSKCKGEKTEAEFHVKEVNGESEKKAAEKENQAPEADAEEQEQSADDGMDLTVLPLANFLDALTQQDDNLDLTARVETSSISGSRKEKADELATRIWNRMKYRFTYHSKYDHKRSPSTRFMYHCAQNKTRQHAPKKSQAAGVKN
ncbi:hypothetical protein B0H11DRAFT_2232085 [Mycena galericulata]|nr:hypothetical protein B0H11DRAFT_2232085 [Mycena galericulata]